MNRITNVAALLSLTAALAACGGGGDVPQPPPSTAAPIAGQIPPGAALTGTLTLDSSCGLPNFQQEVIDLMNQARASSRMCGLTIYDAAPPIRWNSKLFAAAAGHATDMATNNYFSHVSLDGRSFSERITAAGYSWHAAGENIAAGQAGIAQVINDWLQSPAHCVNIMKASYTEAGMSCVQRDASNYQRYWVMEFGHPR